jgi:hypothetical protein
MNRKVIKRRRTEMEPEKEMEQSKEQETFEALNPQAVDAIIGVRSLRKITIYPLSMSDQLRTTDLIAKIMEGFATRTDLEDVAFVAYIVEIIKENLAEILGMVTELDGKDLLKDLTNKQGVEIAEHVFDMNYGSIAKNVRSLAEKVKNLFQSARQSQQ